MPAENYLTLTLRIIAYKWFFRIFDKEKWTEDIKLSLFKTKQSFTRYIGPKDRWVVVKLSIEEDKGDNPEEDEDINGHDVKFVRLISIP